MLYKWGTYWTKGNTYAALDIHEKDGNKEYRYVEVKRKKGELHILNSKKIRDIKELSNLVPKNTPLLLSIGTSKILVKILKSSETENVKALVNATFPNLDLHNFYYEIAQMTKKPILAISKKEYVYNLIEEVKAIGIHVIGFHLSICPLVYSTPYINSGLIQIRNLKINLEDGWITSMTSTNDKTDTTYPINGLDMSGHSLLSFSSILGHLSKPRTFTNFEQEKQQLRGHFQNQRLFTTILRFGLSFFLVLLLVNFLVFEHYNGKIEILNSQIALNQSQSEELLRLEALVKTKRERVENLGAVSSSKSTFYLDKLAKNIPSSLLLDRITYCPLKKPVRDSKPIELRKNTLEVTGISKDHVVFSNWLEFLEKENWISNVETLDYDFLAKDTSIFSIEIHFHETQP